MDDLKLFMVLLGCKPKARFTEQHDVFFGIGRSVKELVPYLKAFWPEGSANLHIDAWRAVTSLAGYRVRVEAKESGRKSGARLFFLNLGGYKPGELDEYHYRQLIVADTIAEAIKTAKQGSFYKHTGFPGAAAHVDDKYGLDVDDAYEVQDLLHPDFTAHYRLAVELSAPASPDQVHLGYLPLHKL